MKDSMFSGVLALLTSRRFLVSVVSLIVGALVVYMPNLQHVQNELLTLITTLALALIGGYSVEDAVTASKGTPASDLKTMRELILEVVESLLEAPSAEEAKAQLTSVQIKKTE